ncbi:hypothetical protein R1sor_012487 [Riccia sorocarpa]|uniref:Uncharacterized protein n=1 Tax=Riccia sorocarpa TaxID=122646 RepID=A0ABD3I813_9MARC
MYWSCPGACRIWSKLKRRADEEDTQFRVPSSLIDTIDMALSDNRKGSVLIHVLASALQSIWKDRNEKTFGKRDIITPVDLILQAARHEAEGLVNKKGSEEQYVGGGRAPPRPRLMRRLNKREDRVRGYERYGGWVLRIQTVQNFLQERRKARQRPLHFTATASATTIQQRPRQVTGQDKGTLKYVSPRWRGPQHFSLTSFLDQLTSKSAELATCLNAIKGRDWYAFP